ncbi:MAG: cell wall hydrolase [Blautia sp.]|nr:cell wall hydrolase [Blautia sp.]
MKRGTKIRVRRMLAAAAGAAVIMLALGASPKEQEETIEQHYGIRMERYLAEKAAEARDEEVLSSTSKMPERQIFSLNGYTQEMLLKLAMAEAGGEDLEGKALVMRVVMNRVLSSDFPATVQEVICEPGQFSPMDDGRYYDMIPDEECEKALYMVMHGWDESRGATYFRTAVTESTWHSENLEELFTHGGHTFYKEKGEQYGQNQE